MTIEEVEMKFKPLEKGAIKWSKSKAPSVSLFMELERAREELVDAIKQYKQEKED